MLKLPSALPTLTGRWLAGYRVIWCVVAALALCGATWGSWINGVEGYRASLTLYNVGLAWDSRGGMKLDPLGPEAISAGVAPASELVAIDGQPVSFSVATQREVLSKLEGDEGAKVTLSMRSATGEVRDVVLTRTAEHLRSFDAASPMSFLGRNIAGGILSTTIFLMMFAAATLLFRRRPGDPVAALLSLGMVTLVATVAINAFAPPTTASAIDPVVKTFAGLCLLLGLLLFPSGRFDSRWTWAGVAALALLPTANLFPELFPDNSVTGSALFILAFGSCIPAIGWRYVKAGPGVERQQIKWVLLGLILFVAFVAAGSAATMSLSGATSYEARFAAVIFPYLFGGLAFPALVGGLLISILRHRLYDADAAISRSVSAGALTVAVVAVFAGAEKVIEVIGEQYLGGSLGNLAGGFAAALAAAMILPLHHGLSRWTERRFQGALTRMRKHLPHDMDEMRDIDTVACLSEAAMRQAMAGVGACQGAVLVRAGDEWRVAAQSTEGAVDWHPEGAGEGLVLDKRDEVWPLRLALPAGGAAVGWLLLGPRPDGTLPGKDERRALDDIAKPIGRAIRVACRREVDAAVLRKRLDRLEAAVSALQPRPKAQPARA